MEQEFEDDKDFKEIYDKMEQESDDFWNDQGKVNIFPVKDFEDDIDYEGY